LARNESHNQAMLLSTRPGTNFAHHSVAEEVMVRTMNRRYIFVTLIGLVGLITLLYSSTGISQQRTRPVADVVQNAQTPRQVQMSPVLQYGSRAAIE
jgi:hypothetical protein